MLFHHTQEKLQQLKLAAMAKGLEEQRNSSQYDSISFEDRLGLLVDRQLTQRQSDRTALRLRKARLRWNAAIQDIDFNSQRGLEKNRILALADGTWLRHHENCTITGLTGTGKTFLACALAHSACMQEYRVLYIRAPKLFEQLDIARNDGQHGKLMALYAKLDLLIIDEWASMPMTNEDRRDMLEIAEERYQRHSTMLISQIPTDNWHHAIGDPTLADAILDRLMHNTHHITISGDSLRKLTKAKDI